jgi:molybdenum cofactor biosynthesis enzyme MoaA
VTPVERFVAVGTNAAARLANGTVIFCFPLDYLAWTEDNARLAESLDRQVSALPDVRGKNIRIAGGISPNARKGLEDLGWKVLDNQKGFST